MSVFNNNTACDSKSKMSQAYNLAGEAATDAIDNVRKQAKVHYDLQRNNAKQAADKTVSFMKERPFLTAGCAFAAGALISALIKK